MKILVTGGGGFIGHYLLYGLSELRGNDIFAYDSKKFNILNKEDVRQAMEVICPDIIFHLAAVSVVKLHDDYHTWPTEVNIIGTQNLLQYAPKGSKFVFASSATVYGNCDNGADRYEHDMPNPSSVYAITKLACEYLVKVYAKQRELDYLILRYVANVGLRATHGVLKDIIRKINEEKNTITLLGAAPGSTKPYMHVSDTVSATIHLATTKLPNSNRTFNISPTDTCNVEEIANIVMYGLQKKRDIIWNPEGNWKGDDNRVHIAPGRLYETGWKPKYYLSRDAILQAARESV